MDVDGHGDVTLECLGMLQELVLLGWQSVAQLLFSNDLRLSVPPLASSVLPASQVRADQGT